MSGEEVRYLTAEQRARLAALEEMQRKENSVEIANPLIARIVPASGKIYDITESDTNEHTVALPAGYPENTRALQVQADRVSGSGVFGARNSAGGRAITVEINRAGIWMRATDGLFHYYLTVANDDFDIHCVGYFTGGR